MGILTGMRRDSFPEKGFFAGKDRKNLLSGSVFLSERGISGRVPFKFCRKKSFRVGCSKLGSKNMLGLIEFLFVLTQDFQEDFFFSIF